MEALALLPSERVEANLLLVRSIAKSVLAGTFGGAFLPLCLLLPAFLFGFADPSVSAPWSRALLLLYPVGFSFAFTCLGMALIGWPVTILLKRIRKEGPGIYAVIGAIAGAVVALGFFAGAGLFVACGAMSGALTGYVWGSCRSLDSPGC